MNSFMRIIGRRNKAGQDEVGEKDNGEKGNYPAALRVAAPLLPSVAVLVTILVYLLSRQVAKIVGPGEEAKINSLTDALWGFMYGDLAVLGGLFTGLLVWFVVAYFQRPYTRAYYVSRRNYNGLSERLDNLTIRVKEGEKLVQAAQSVNGDNCALQSIRSQALELAKTERDAIEKGLKSRGMPMVTGLGYIELWHRVHRAEEALIKFEPCAEVLEGAMRDESRLTNANMQNSETLRKQLDEAVAILERSETVNKLSVLAKPGRRSKDENAQVTPEEGMKARNMLCEIRFEINNFRDNSWEGLVNLRNRLADTVVLLGLTTFALLALAIFLEAPRKTIIWAGTYFLIGAIAGLFARAQSEWGAETAVDDFGLSKTRLLQIPWLSGLAATGGVVITSLLDPQSKTVDLASVFSNRPSLLFVAAVFGITPSLLIRRLDDQADKSKDDLESTQTSQSTEDRHSISSTQRYTSRVRTR